VVEILWAGMSIVAHVNDLVDALQAKSAAMGLNLTSQQILHLARYVELLLKWNKVYSLTAITDMHEVLVYHIVDGLSVVKYLNDSKLDFSNILDVGSGMGVPGIILAISYPQINVVLVDSNSKKTTFLRQVVIELGLKNVEVLTHRVENYHIENGYDIIVSRAFARLNLFVELTRHLLSPSGFFLAMKSKKIVEELAELGDEKVEIIETQIPGVLDKRFLVKISNG